MAGNNQNNNAQNASPTFEVKVNGQVIPIEYNLVSLVVYNAVNRLANARMVFLDGDAASAGFNLSNKPDFVPGAPVEISSGYKGNNSVIFKGLVVKHAIQLKENKSTFLIIDCRHDAVKATKVRNNKIFTDQKDSDIFTTLLQPLSISVDVAATTVTHKEMVQFNCTDWDFIVTRAEANGMLVITDEAKLKIAPPVLSGNGVMDLCYGGNLFEFNMELDARHHFDTVNAWGWDAAEQQPVSADGSAPAGLQPLGNVSAADIAAKTGSGTIDFKTSALLTEPELKAWADGRRAKYELSKITGRAKCQGSENLKTGVLVKLQGVGDRFSGVAYVTGVRHEINQGNWLTDVQFGLSPSSFIGNNDVNAFPAEGMLPAVNGLQVGTVTQIENDPLGEDRILVKLPLLDSAAQGIWARQALLDAGNARGSFFRPEIGDEVIVGFINNDPRHAVLLGMVNSSAKPAVMPAKDTNHEKGFVTREKMKLWFNDEKKVVEIATPAGNSFTMSEDQKQISLKDQNGNEITLSKDGIVIKSVKDITLDGASGKIGISGKELEAAGTTTATVKGNSSAEISSSGSTTVKGSTVMIN